MTTSRDSALYSTRSDKDDKRPLVAFTVLSQVSVGIVSSAAGAVVTWNERSTLGASNAILLQLFAAVLVAELLERYAFYYSVVPFNPPARYVQILDRFESAA